MIVSNWCQIGHAWFGGASAGIVEPNGRALYR